MKSTLIACLVLLAAALALLLRRGAEGGTWPETDDDMAVW